MEKQTIGIHTYQWVGNHFGGRNNIMGSDAIKNVTITM